VEDFKKRLTKDLAEHINPEEASSVEAAFERALQGMVDRIKPIKELEKIKTTERELERKLENKILSRDDFDEWL